jgi:hypothetical protein
MSSACIEQTRPNAPTLCARTGVKGSHRRQQKMRGALHGPFKWAKYIVESAWYTLPGRCLAARGAPSTVGCGDLVPVIDPASLARPGLQAQQQDPCPQ